MHVKNCFTSDGAGHAQARLTFRVAIAVVMACVLLKPGPANAQGCLPAASDTVDFVGRIKGLLVDPAEGASLLRNSIGITGVDTATVVVVADSVRCAVGAAAIHAQVQLPVPTTPIYVFIEAGPRLLVYDPGSTGHVFLHVLTQTSEYVKSILAY